MSPAKPLPPSSGSVAHSWHPLEMIPVFRRWPCSVWRDLLYTLLLNTAIAVTLTLIAFLYLEAPFTVVFSNTWVYSNAIGFAIHSILLVNRLVLGARQLAWSSAVRALWHTLIAAPGIVLGYLAATWLLADRIDLATESSRLRAILILALLISIMLSAASVAQARVARKEALERQQQLRRTEAEHLATQARLRLLQAQIEPHFLFNTLANVTSMIDTEPLRAKRMLEDFTEFLRASLASLREPDTTLRRERELLSAYLRVLEVRMGHRLQYEFTLEEGTLDCLVPAMVLQPLVENAIKHGIDPAPQGGKVTIGSERRADRLILTVTDNGVGHRANGRMGVGLGSLQERLRVEHGARASLAIEQPAGGGTRVVVALPAEAAT